MKNEIKLSLIISFYNDINWLKMIFEMLKVQSFKDFEVVIADDGSSQEIVNEINVLVETVSFPVKHIWHPDNGWQKNIILNKAIVASGGNYLVFIDGDCIPHKKFLEEHYLSAQHGTVIAGRRVQLTEKITKRITPKKIANKYLSNCYFALFMAYLKGEIPHGKNLIRIRNPFIRKIFVKERKKGLLGCNFSIYKNDILKVNGFDERFPNPGYGEDTDLEARLNRIGIYVITKNHLVTVYHKWHIRKEVEGDINPFIYKENNDNKVSYTPYGINKKQDDEYNL